MWGVEGRLTSSFSEDVGIFLTSKSSEESSREDWPWQRQKRRTLAPRSRMRSEELSMVLNVDRTMSGVSSSLHSLLFSGENSGGPGGQVAFKLLGPLPL